MIHGHRATGTLIANQQQASMTAKLASGLQVFPNQNHQGTR